MDQKCKFCGTPLEGYETFCPGCGRELPEQSGAGFRPEDAEDTYAREFVNAVPDTQAATGDEWFPEAFDEPKPAVPQRKFITARPDQPNPVRAEEPARPRPTRRETHPDQAAPVRRRPAAERTAAQPKPAKPQPDRKPRTAADLTGRQRKLLLGALTVVAVLLLLIGGKMILGGGEKRVTYPFTPVVDRYFEAVRTGNANTFIDTRPGVYTTYLTTGTGSAYENESDYRAQTAATLQTRLAGYEAQYGNIRSIEYELTEVRRYNHRCEALSDVLEGWYGFPDNAVSDAYIVNGTYTIKGAKGAGEHAIEELLLIQIDGNWYFSPDAGSYWRAE